MQKQSKSCNLQIANTTLFRGEGAVSYFLLHKEKKNEQSCLLVLMLVMPREESLRRIDACVYALMFMLVPSEKHHEKYIYWVPLFDIELCLYRRTKSKVTGLRLAVQGLWQPERYPMLRGFYTRVTKRDCTCETRLLMLPPPASAIKGVKLSTKEQTG